MNEPQRGKALWTMCPEDLMQLLRKALIIVFTVTISLIISGLYENSQGVSIPSLGRVTGTYNRSN